MMIMETQIAGLGFLWGNNSNSTDVKRDNCLKKSELNSYLNW